MHTENLLAEGDVNFSKERQIWKQTLSEKANIILEYDADVFFHQSLSTPCLQAIESCEGIYFTDVDGKIYMDFHGNNVHQLGYRNQYIVEKLKQQMDTLPFSPRRFTNTVTVEFAKKLLSYMPADLNRLLFTPGGTSAISMALKLARVVTGKTRVVSLKDSFHGASLDAIAAGDEEQFKKYMGENIGQNVINISQPETYRNPYTDDIHYANELEEVLSKNNNVGAFIAETVRNTDVQVPSVAYWKKIREICDKYKILLILDEIPIAFGRTGRMFAFEHYGITPDILCLGKGMGGGIFPFAAMVSKDEYNIASDVSLGHYTHEKSPLGCAAGLALLEYMESHQILEQVKTNAEFFKNELLKLKDKYPLIGDIRGVGLLWGIELVTNKHTKDRAVQEAEKIMYECLRNGLSFKVSQGNVLQLSPPLIINQKQLAEACSIIDRSFAKITNQTL